MKRNAKTGTARAVWIRVLPLVVIALCAVGLSVQAACSGGSGDTPGTTYGYQ